MFFCLQWVVLNVHVHQLSVLISCVLCVRCVSSDEDCLSPGAPTGADVSFFSTLGCSLWGALTGGSMALALLSPFIWSERALAPVLVCRWPYSHLTSPLSPHELPWQLAATISSRQTRRRWASQTHPLQTQTHTHLCGWMLRPRTNTVSPTPTFF